MPPTPHKQPATPKLTLFNTPLQPQTPSSPQSNTSHSPQTFLGWSLGDDTLSANIFPTTPKTSSPLVNESIADESPVSAMPLYNRNYFRGVIDTIKGRHPTHGTIEYITIRDVFTYVTLGMSVCDSHLEEITDYVTREVTNYITHDIQETSFHGRAYMRSTPVFSFEQYGEVAKCCLNWALSNPEKLAPS